jgi:hypothetical protein
MAQFPKALIFLLSLLVTFTGCSSKNTDFQEEVDRRKEIINRQEAEMARQERERQDIERQKFWNEQLKRYE